MTALTLRNNAYASDRDLRLRYRSSVPRRENSGCWYSRGASSRSLSEDLYPSSFLTAADVIDSLFKVSGAEVYRYVQKHAQLFPMLLKSRAEIYWTFGPRTAVLLRIEHDPEDEYQERLLVAIQTSLSAACAVSLIDTIDDRWWLSVNPEMRSLMKIDVEYV